MKRFFYLALILAIFTFASCKKSEDNSDQSKDQAQAEGTKASGKKGKKGGAPVALQIYQEDKLVATVAPDQYEDLTTADVKVDGKDYKGILLSDLLKKYNLTGKTVTLHGPAKETSITWEQATANPIYVYLQPQKKGRLQLYTDSKNLETVKLPQMLIKITAAQNPPAGQTSETSDQAKGQKKAP